MALRNKSFGQAQEFVWSHDSSQYATREGSSTVQIFKNFKEQKSFKPDFGAEGQSLDWSEITFFCMCCMRFVNLRNLHNVRHNFEITYAQFLDYLPKPDPNPNPSLNPNLILILSQITQCILQIVQNDKLCEKLAHVVLICTHL